MTTSKLTPRSGDLPPEDAFLGGCFPEGYEWDPDEDLFKEGGDNAAAAFELLHFVFSDAAQIVCRRLRFFCKVRSG